MFKGGRPCNPSKIGIFNGFGSAPFQAFGQEVGNSPPLTAAWCTKAAKCLGATKASKGGEEVAATLQGGESLTAEKGDFYGMLWHNCVLPECLKGSDS